jgi:hypothetical protein
LVIGLVFTVLEIVFVWLHMSNLWLFHVYRLLSQVVYSLIFSAWSTNVRIKHLINWSLIAFVIFWCVCKLTVESFASWDTYSSTVSNVLLIAISASLLFPVGLPAGALGLQPYQMGITAAVLMSAIGDSLVFAFGSSFVQMGGMEARQLYAIHWLVTTFSNLILTWAFLARARTDPPTEYEIQLLSVIGRSKGNR